MDRMTRLQSSLNIFENNQVFQTPSLFADYSVSATDRYYTHPRYRSYTRNQQPRQAYLSARNVNQTNPTHFVSEVTSDINRASRSKPDNTPSSNVDVDYDVLHNLTSDQHKCDYNESTPLSDTKISISDLTQEQQQRFWSWLYDDEKTYFYSDSKVVKWLQTRSEPEQASAGATALVNDHNVANEKTVTETRSGSMLENTQLSDANISISDITGEQQQTSSESEQTNAGATALVNDHNVPNETTVTEARSSSMLENTPPSDTKISISDLTQEQQQRFWSWLYDDEKTYFYSDSKVVKWLQTRSEPEQASADATALVNDHNVPNENTVTETRSNSTLENLLRRGTNDISAFYLTDEQQKPVSESEQANKSENQSIKIKTEIKSNLNKFIAAFERSKNVSLNSRHPSTYSGATLGKELAALDAGHKTVVNILNTLDTKDINQQSLELIHFWSADGLVACVDRKLGAMDEIVNILEKNDSYLSALSESAPVSFKDMRAHYQAIDNRNTFNKCVHSFEYTKNGQKTKLVDEKESVEYILSLKTLLSKSGINLGSTSNAFHSGIHLTNRVTEEFLEYYQQESFKSSEQLHDRICDDIIGNEHMLTQFLTHCEKASKLSQRITEEKQEQQTTLSDAYCDDKLTDDEFNQQALELEVTMETKRKNLLRAMLMRELAAAAKA
ncbi:MAG: hypothetical protein PUP46_08440 [Endozoicomonas sp. (ex Botrylloides leachii)]|nr:hypothetical protein [Endozoicomonas sp. (ex Botrylloides leachii)]